MGPSAPESVLLGFASSLQMNRIKVFHCKRSSRLPSATDTSSKEPDTNGRIPCLFGTRVDTLTKAYRHKLNDVGSQYGMTAFLWAGVMAHMWLLGSIVGHRCR